MKNQSENSARAPASDTPHSNHKVKQAEMEERIRRIREAENAAAAASLPPPWLYPRKVSDLNSALPPQIIKGVLYQGCRFVFGGSPKAKKSWLLMQACYCIANGLAFLGIQTAKGKVVYINFELLEGECRKRFFDIHKALGTGDVDQVEVIQLKDKKLGPAELIHLQRVIKEGDFVLGAFDPVYKLLDGCDERIGKEVSPILSALAAICEVSHASVGYAQHFAKGNQALKFAIDRISGSNYFVRDADVILVMTDLAEEGCHGVEVIQRSFPDIKPFGIRWQNPIFVRDDSIDVTDIKQPGDNGKKADPITERMLGALHAANYEGGLTSYEFWHASQVINSKGAMSPSRATFARKLKVLIERKIVEKSVATEKYTLTVQYAQQRADSFHENDYQ
jgi:hypothetical protein